MAFGSRKTANLAPFFRACVAMVELQGHWGEREVHFWMIFRYVVLAGPLGRAFWRSFCVLGWLLR